jgi:hypothetical protein
MRALSQTLDLLAEDNRLNVYAGELDVRPPWAPSIGSSARLNPSINSRDNCESFAENRDSAIITNRRAPGDLWGLRFQVTVIR